MFSIRRGAQAEAGLQASVPCCCSQARGEGPLQLKYSTEHRNGLLCARKHMRTYSCSRARQDRYVRPGDHVTHAGLRRRLGGASEALRRPPHMIMRVRTCTATCACARDRAHVRTCPRADVRLRYSCRLVNRFTKLVCHEFLPCPVVLLFLACLCYRARACRVVRLSCPSGGGGRGCVCVRVCGCAYVRACVRE